jgi:hypothetical protein
VVPVGLVTVGVSAGVVVLARVTVLTAAGAGDQHPGQGPVAGQPPAGLRAERPGPAGLAPDGAGAAQQAVQVHRDDELGPHAAGLGQLAALEVAAGQLGRGVGAALGPLRSSAALCGRARGSRAARRIWPASGSSSPWRATMPSRVAANHIPRCSWRRSSWRSAPSGSVT